MTICTWVLLGFPVLLIIAALTGLMVGVRHIQKSSGGDW